MANASFNPNYSGDWDATGSNYFTVHDAVSATVSVSDFFVGQWKFSTTYHVNRAALSFDTSGLDDSCIIQSATLTMGVASVWDYAREFDVIIKSGAPTYPHTPVVNADYALSNYSGNGGSKNSSYAKAGEGFAISLNSTGLGWINKTGNTKIALISSYDVAKDTPTGYEYVSFYNNPGAGYPTLSIVYFIPTGIPVVGDPTFSNTKATYTKATADVSDDGGGYEERGFEYGTSEVATWAVRETGVWGATGNYSLTLPNLLPLTTYYARAYVANSYGTGYSDWTSFTTTDVPSYGIHEEDNTATICFYISEDDGHTWGQKHGPYTTDQADIEITKLLVRGSGKKKIKFESDTLTGISASIMCKLDLKAR